MGRCPNRFYSATCWRWRAAFLTLILIFAAVAYLPMRKPETSCCSVVAAELVKRRGKREKKREGTLHWRQVIVVAEVFILAVVSFAPQSMNTAVNIAISFVCAMQVETFRKVRGSAFATTMCTGNLRSGTEQLMIWHQSGDRKAARKARHYYAIILCFIAGAAFGALCTDAWGERALLLTCVPLLTVFSLMFREQESRTFR